MQRQQKQRPSLMFGFGTVKRAVFGQRSVAWYCIAARNVLRHPPRAWAHAPGGNHATPLSRGKRVQSVSLTSTRVGCRSKTGSHEAEDATGGFRREEKMTFGAPTASRSRGGCAQKRHSQAKMWRPEEILATMVEQT